MAFSAIRSQKLTTMTINTINFRKHSLEIRIAEPDTAFGFQLLQVASRRPATLRSETLAFDDARLPNDRGRDDDRRKTPQPCSMGLLCQMNVR